jgi:putative ABC transport system substrate-binding protein
VRRRDFIAALGGAAACPVVALAQPRDQTKRIAFVSSFRVVEPVFTQELARLGWVEGRNARIETLLEDYRAVRAAAPFLVATAPDLLVVVGTENARTFKELTDTIPIIFAFVADPIAINLVKNLAHPGGNLTGFSHLPHSSLAGKWLNLLTDLVPRIDRVMVLYDPAHAIFVSMLQEAAPKLNVMIHPALPTAIADAEREIEIFARDPGSGMMVVPYDLTIRERETIVRLAARHRLPTIYASDLFTAVGGLVSYGPDTADISRNVARYADRILRGAKSADLPVQAPTRFRLVINAKVAMALGLTVPPTLIADEVIE